MSIFASTLKQIARAKPWRFPTDIERERQREKEERRKAKQGGKANEAKA